MKKLIIIITVILLLLPLETAVHAEETVSSSDDPVFSLDPDEYIPGEISDILKENGIEQSEELSFENVFSLIFSLIGTSLSLYSDRLILMFITILIFGMIASVLDNDKCKTIISYIIQLILISLFADIFIDLSLKTESTVQVIADILKAVLPAFSGILLLGGGSFSAACSSASFSAVLFLIEQTVIKIIIPLADVLVTFLMLERLSPQFSSFDTVKTLKKTLLSVFSFLTTMFLTVLSYQGIISSAKDGVSMKTVKFAASSFVPIIGSALGESYKTVSVGIKMLKTSVGFAVSLSLFITVLPLLISFFVLKTELLFLSFTGTLTGAGEIKSFFESAASMIDIFSAIIICIMLLSLLLIVVFSFSAVSVSL